MATHVLERRGSSKDIWKTLGDKGEVTGVHFIFSDRVSVFDIGPIPIQFNGLGQLRCAIASKVFHRLNAAGFNTHYLSHDAAAARMYVQPVNIPQLNQPVDYGELSIGEIIPLEFLCRLRMTPKFIDRLKVGAVPRPVYRIMSVGEPEPGEPLVPPYPECSTKFEEADRYLSDEEAAVIAGKSEEWFGDEVYPYVIELFSQLRSIFEGSFLLYDGKVELAITKDGRIVLVDSISPDEVRLVGRDGRSYDKDPVREWYQATFPEWHAELLAAKKEFPSDKSRWPTYPGVPPQSVIDDLLERYRMVAEAIRAI